MPADQVFQACVDTIASFVVCVSEGANNVLLDLRLSRFLKEVTQ
jgi:hypothetical protein